MNRSTTTDRDFNERLVAEVEKKEILYNTKHPQYKDRYKVELEWQSIANIMESTVINVKKRWQHLRGSYSKSLGMKYLSSGSAATPNRSRFYLAEQMGFLQRYISHAPTIGNYSDSVIVEIPVGLPGTEDASSPEAEAETFTLTPEGAGEEEETPSQPIQPAKPKGKKRKTEDPLEAAIATYLTEKAVNKREEASPSQNEDLNFFKGLMTQVGQLNKTKKRQYFRDISALLFEKLEEQENEEKMCVSYV